MSYWALFWPKVKTKRKLSANVIYFNLIKLWFNTERRCETDRISWALIGRPLPALPVWSEWQCQSLSSAHRHIDATKADVCLKGHIVAMDEWLESIARITSVSTIRVRCVPIVQWCAMCPQWQWSNAGLIGIACQPTDELILCTDRNVLL